MSRQSFDVARRPFICPVIDGLSDRKGKVKRWPERSIVASSSYKDSETFTIECPATIR